MVTVPEMILSHPSLPAKNVRELVALAKSRPGQLQYSTGGVGSIQHLAMELFLITTGTKMLHVPYKATHPALIDAIAGHVPITVVASLSGLPHMRSGRLRGYGVTSAKRMLIAPDIPTIAEQGVKDFEVVGWFGMFAPAKTPPAIVAQLNAAANKALAVKEVNDRMLSSGVEVVGGEAASFAKQVKSDVQKWNKVADQAGLTK